MRSCMRCDQANPDDAQFCTRCGMPQALAALPNAQLPAPQLIQVNVTGAPPTTAPAGAPAMVVVIQQVSGPGCLVRGIYFLFIGVWLGLLWTGAAWVLLITVLGLPLGLLMLNRLPQVMTLKPVRT